MLEDHREATEATSGCLNCQNALPQVPDHETHKQRRPEACIKPPSTPNHKPASRGTSTGTAPAQAGTELLG